MTLSFASTTKFFFFFFFHITYHNDFEFRRKLYAVLNSLTDMDEKMSITSLTLINFLLLLFKFVTLPTTAFTHTSCLMLLFVQLLINMVRRCNDTLGVLQGRCDLVRKPLLCMYTKSPLTCSRKCAAGLRQGNALWEELKHQQGRGHGKWTFRWEPMAMFVVDP